MCYYLTTVPGQYTHTVTHICRHCANWNTNMRMKSFKHVG